MAIGATTICETPSQSLSHNCLTYIAFMTLVTCSLLAILSINATFGPISPPLRRAVSISLLVAALMCEGRLSGSRGFRLSGFHCTLALLLVGILIAPIRLIELACAISIVALLESRVLLRAGHITTGLGLASVSYLMLDVVRDLTPSIHSAENFICAGISHYVSRMSGRNLSLGPTAVSLTTIEFLGLLSLSKLVLYRSWQRLAVGLAIMASSILAHGPAALILGKTAYPSYQFAACMATIGLILTACLTGIGPCHALPINRSRCSLSSPLTLASVAVGIALGTASIGPFNYLQNAHRSIVVYNRGGLDWDRPIYGKFGGFSGGMFGLLPVYARAEGYSFSIIDKDTIEPSDLKGKQVLVLVNSPKIWSGAERAILLDFVERGGGLLILGDHTDVFGLMVGFNSLLAPLGIEFQFDSAYPAREGWRDCSRSAPDAFCSTWESTNSGIAIGASLKVRGRARPLVTGRYSHSDAGMRQNVIGSFLGNYAYDDGEQYGDQILAATVTYGSGRIIVFGDTSPFQGGLSHTYPNVVAPLLEVLARPTALIDRHYARSLLGIIGLSYLCLLAFRRPSPSAFVALALSILLGLSTARIITEKYAYIECKSGKDVIFVDQSHLPAIGHYRARVNSIGPLYSSILRSGFRVLDLENWNAGRIEASRGIVFVAPQMRFSDRQVLDLIKAEINGCVVILVAGQPDSKAAEPLLRAHSLGLAPRPMGTLPPGGFNGSSEMERVPRFVDPWPIVPLDGGISATNSDWEVLYRYGDDVVALYCRRGRGGLLLISDTRFFSSMNVEDISSFHLGNLAFIHDVFQRVLSADAESVTPVFRSPRMPE